MITPEQKRDLVNALSNEGFEITLDKAYKGKFLKEIKDPKLQALFAKFQASIQEIKTALQYDKILAEIDSEECDSLESVLKEAGKDPDFKIYKAV